MAVQIFSNNAETVLASPISASDTSLTLFPGHGARFPSPAAGDWFVLTLFKLVGALESGHEIVRCNARTGDVLTIVRAQESTVASAFAAGDNLQLRLTAAPLNAMSAGANLVQLAVIAIGSQAQVLYTFPASGYDAYVIEGSSISVASNDYLCMNFISDSGFNYLNLINNADAVSIKETRFYLGGIVEESKIAASGKGSSFRAHIVNPNDVGKNKCMFITSCVQTSVDTFAAFARIGVWTGNNKVTGFRLFQDRLGLFTSGQLRVYGVRS